MAQLVPVGDLTWTASTSPDTIGYNVYYGDDVSVSYASPKVDVGNVTTISLPLAGQPAVDGVIKYGIAAYDEVGNESDLTVVSVTLDTIAPNAVTNLVYVAP